MPIIDIERRRVEYVLEGAGELVVFSQPTWWPMDAWFLSGRPQLRDEYQLLFFNFRGIGASDGTPEPYSVYSLADGIAQLMDALDLTQPAHLICFAIGSVVGLKTAVRHPARVRSLVVAAAGAGAPASAPSAADRDRAHLKEVGFREYIRGHALDPELFSPANAARNPTAQVALADALWDHQGPLDEYLKHGEARRGHRTTEGAEDIHQPALVLCGEEDNVARGASTPVKTAQELASVLPNAQLHLIPGVRHMTYWEDPDAAWGPVTAFLHGVAQ
ncbi:MAG: alpha/beta fold hydrolase [Chloroflexi bacterium]|nr:alpha/beta fold hydrolase [Chloroflexota bacterium]